MEGQRGRGAGPGRGRVVKAKQRPCRACTSPARAVSRTTRTEHIRLDPVLNGPLYRGAQCVNASRCTSGHLYSKASPKRIRKKSKKKETHHTTPTTSLATLQGAGPAGTAARPRHPTKGRHASGTECRQTCVLRANPARFESEQPDEDLHPCSDLDRFHPVPTPNTAPLSCTAIPSRSCRLRVPGCWMQLLLSGT